MTHPIADFISNRARDYITLFLRIVLGISFRSAVGDRFRLWEAYGQPNVLWNPPSTGSYFQTEETGLTKYYQKVAVRPTQLKQLAALRAQSRSILGTVASQP